MTAADPVSASTQPARPRLLLIDDERPYLEVLHECLKDEFDVEIAENTEEAGALIKKCPFDVVVCDHMMPGEQGLTFLMRTCEEYPKMRRIMMTGYMNPELLSRSVPLAQLSSLVLKPVGAVELSRVIRAALAKG